jgi:AraC family transcriptional regulator
VKPEFALPQSDQSKKPTSGGEQLQPRSPLIRSEVEWLKPPSLESASDGRESQVILSRWVIQEPASPIEFSSNGAEDAHTLTFFRKMPIGEWHFGGKPFNKGYAPADSLWIKEPFQEARAIYYECFTCFRVYLPQALLAECYETAYGRAPDAHLVLSKTKRVDCPTLKHLVKMLVDVDDNGGPAGPVFLDGISLAIASCLLALDSKRAQLKFPGKQPSELSRWRLNRSIEYIEANLLKPIYLIELSNAVGLSRMHFAAQFRAATGYTPNRYILRRKIAHAQTLLRNPSMSIVNIALALGFRTQAHFTFVFKSIVGHPPAYWRKHCS